MPYFKVVSFSIDLWGWSSCSGIGPTKRKPLSCCSSGMMTLLWVLIVVHDIMIAGASIPEFPSFYALSFAAPIISPTDYSIGETWYIESYEGLGANKKPLFTRQVPNPPVGVTPPTPSSNFEYLDFFVIESFSSARMQGSFQSPITSSIIPYFRIKPCSDASCLISDVEHIKNTSYLLMALGSPPDKQIAKFNMDTCEPLVYGQNNQPVSPTAPFSAFRISLVPGADLFVSIYPFKIWSLGTLQPTHEVALDIDRKSVV